MDAKTIKKINATIEQIEKMSRLRDSIENMIATLIIEAERDENFDCIAYIRLEEAEQAFTDFYFEDAIVALEKAVKSLSD